jgi:hypothetical protein
MIFHLATGLLPEIEAALHPVSGVTMMHGRPPDRLAASND